MSSYGESSYGELSYGENLSLDGGIQGSVSEGLTLSAIQSGTWTASITASEDIELTLGILGKKTFNAFPTEDLQISDAIAFKEILNIVESIRVSETLTPSGTFGILSVEGLETSDRLFVGFPISVLDAMGITDSQVVQKQQLIDLLDQVEIAESLSTATVWNISGTDELKISDSTDRYWSQVISEILSTSDTLLVHRVATINQEEIIEVSDSIVESLQYAVALISKIFLSENALVGAQQTAAIIEENITLSALFNKKDIQGYCMNPENYAISKYLLGFTEASAFGDKFLFADDTGLYELGGKTDNGDAIISTIQTAALDLGTSNIKQVPSVMLGTDGDKAILKVSVDGSHTTHYEITDRSSALMTKHVKLGKGLKGKYWQFTIITDGDDFNLDTFEFYPITFGRKHNG